jgi:hypothetical protein
MRIARCPRGSQGASRHDSGRRPVLMKGCRGKKYEHWSAEGKVVHSPTSTEEENRGVRVRTIRISLVDALGTPNPVRRRDGVTIWQMRRISNCVQSCASIRRRSCASTSRQNSVIIDGMDSGAICGHRSWDVPNSDMSVRAGRFICRMQADEENTIIPESGEERRGDCLVFAPETAC